LHGVNCKFCWAIQNRGFFKMIRYIDKKVVSKRLLPVFLSIKMYLILMIRWLTRLTRTSVMPQTCICTIHHRDKYDSYMHESR